MLSIFDELREFTLSSMAVRLLLATVCGGVIGLEREYKRRPAGFRTHILICLGAAMTTLTSQFLCLEMHLFADMGRLGAQVVAGIGFIGAGAIIVTPHQRVKGLTTAAGLWAAAIIGLTLGAGYYEGAIIVTLLILLAELLFSKLEYRIMRNIPEIYLYIEYEDKASLEQLLELYKKKEIKVLNMELTRSVIKDRHKACAIFYLRLNKQCKVDQLLELVNCSAGVLSAVEL